MSRRNSDEYNFVGLVRSPVKQTPIAVGSRAGYYASGSKTPSEQAEQHDRESSSAAPTDRMSTGSNRSSIDFQQHRGVLLPVTANAVFETHQATPSSFVSEVPSFKTSNRVGLESASRSTVLTGRALRLTPMTEEKGVRNTEYYSDESSPVRSPLFSADPSPVSNRLADGDVPARPMETNHAKFTHVATPQPSSSRRSPVPAFTPGFEDRDHSVYQPSTPAMPDPYLSSMSCGVTDGGSDDGQWSDQSDYSFSRAVFSPGPTKDVALSAVQTTAVERRRAARSGTPATPSIERTSPLISMNDSNNSIDVGVTPLRVRNQRDSNDGLPAVSDTPAAISALLQMARDGGVAPDRRSTSGRSDVQSVRRSLRAVAAPAEGGPPAGSGGVRVDTAETEDMSGENKFVSKRMDASIDAQVCIVIVYACTAISAANVKITV